MAPRRDHRHAVDIRPAGLEAHLDPFLIVVAERLGADLSDLVAGQKPAELQIDRRLALAMGIDADQRGGRGSAGGSSQEIPTSDLSHSSLQHRWPNARPKPSRMD